MSRPRKYRAPEEAVANVLERALVNFGYGNRGRWIENLGELAAPLAELRERIVENLGGEENVGEIKRHMIEVSLKQRLILDTLDAYIFAMPSIINKSRRTVFGIVSERMKVAEGLNRLYDKIGYDVKKNPEDAMAAYMRKKYGKKADKLFGGATAKAIDVEAESTSAETETDEDREERQFEQARNADADMVVARNEVDADSDDSDEGREDSPLAAGGSAAGAFRRAGRRRSQGKPSNKNGANIRPLRTPRRFPDDIDDVDDAIGELADAEPFIRDALLED